MKKITLLLMMMLTSTLVFAQTLPLDFEVPEDDAFEPFNGATAGVVVDPTDAANNVLELVSNGAPFDGATVNMATFVDLSDDTNNTITMEFWAPDATTRTHLFQLKGGTGASPQIQLFFNTTAAGWQTVTLNFSEAGPTLSDNYFLIDIFADAGGGNTATGTYYIDDIDGPNGAVVPVDPIPSTPSPLPTAPDAETYSIYNDTNGYTTIFPVAYSFGSLSGEPDLGPEGAENRALKLNFGVEGFGQGEGGPDDVTAYDFVSFDYWAGAGVVGFDFVMISNDGGISEHKYQISIQEPVVNESWVKVEIPMSYFTDLGFSDATLFQWKLGPLNDSVDNDGIVYVDNILLTQNSTLSTNQFSQADFTVYPNPTQNVWNIKTTVNISSVKVYNLLGNLVLNQKVDANEAIISSEGLATGVYFVKIENEANYFKTVKVIKN